MMQVSVIIPTLNEASSIAGLIQQTRLVGDCEIIVIDGGSSDGTVERAHAADIVLSTKSGRANQQNSGAAASSGNVLLFLHADCQLQPGCFDAIAAALENPNCVGGAFRQTIDATGLRYRILEWGNSVRVKLFGWAYGDQGIFVRRETFEELGGFPDFKLMEDLFFMKCLKKTGKVTLLNHRITVSARRWQKKGIIRQTIRNWALITAAHCGINPNKLARFYPHVR